MTMIKDLKKMAAGTEIKGFPLMIKTARQTFKDADGNIVQEVVFMDSSGEMTGHILLENEAARWKSKTNICIMLGVIQDTDERKKEAEKLFVFECFDAATPLTFDQSQELQAEDWKRLRQDEIKGKIRHGQVCGYMDACVIRPKMTGPEVEAVKESILYWQEFVISGE